MPVLNEARHLRAAVGHVMGQDYPGPLEMVIALGPSTDGTDELAADIVAADSRISTMRNPTGRTPAALNVAIAASSYPVIVRVDGHGMLSPDYVRTAVELLAETGADNVGGVMAAEGETAFERAVARAMTSPLGVGNARFHTGGEPGEVDTVYLGVFRRETVEKLGGYDESFKRAQDWELNHRIKAAGGRVWFSPRLRVSYRPRPNLRALARQYFEYGRWRRVVMRQHEGTVTLRYLAPPIALSAVVLGTLAGVAISPVAFVVPAGYVVGILAGSVATGRGLSPKSWLVLPAVYATMHGSWAVGFLTSPRSLVPSPAPVTADLSH
jgi:glycosyltransferase involved in cell wall biosynthesis